MPEFILDHGSQESARAFRALDSFTQGYIEAMFFTDNAPNAPDVETFREQEASGENEGTFPSDASVADLAPETLTRIIADCQRFQTANAALLEQASALEPGSEGLRYTGTALDDRRLGMLFWYRRNGHGVSFTDDGCADCLHSLNDACGWRTAFGEVSTYLGDDDLIYLA